MMSGNVFVWSGPKPVLGGDPTVILRVARGSTLEQIERNVVWLALEGPDADPKKAADLLDAPLKRVKRIKLDIAEAGQPINLGARLSNDEVLIVVKQGQKLDEVKRNAVKAVLDLCDGNRSKAAPLLGISVRTIQRRYSDLTRRATPATAAAAS